jgi:hypothetical protein
MTPLQGSRGSLKKLILTCGLALGTVLWFGCSSVQNAVDCNGICDRYQECFDSTYDTSSCESRCRSNANSEADYMAKASDCDSCLGDKSCAGATFECGSQCIGIVP